MQYSGKANSRAARDETWPSRMHIYPYCTSSLRRTRIIKSISESNAQRLLNMTEYNSKYSANPSNARALQSSNRSSFECAIRVCTLFQVLRSTASFIINKYSRIISELPQPLNSQFGTDSHPIRPLDLRVTGPRLMPELDASRRKLLSPHLHFSHL